MSWSDIIAYLGLLVVVGLWFYQSSKRQRELAEINRDLTAALAQLKNPMLSSYIEAAMESRREAKGPRQEPEEEFEDAMLG